MANLFENWSATKDALTDGLAGNKKSSNGNSTRKHKAFTF